MVIIKFEVSLLMQVHFAIMVDFSRTSYYLGVPAVLRWTAATHAEMMRIQVLTSISYTLPGMWLWLRAMSECLSHVCTLYASVLLLRPPLFTA